MTPMMFSAGAAGAAPAGPIDAGDPSTGAAHSGPGSTSALTEDAGLDAFDVALLAILERATLGDADARSSTECIEPDGGEALPGDGTLRGRWLQSVCGAYGGSESLDHGAGADMPVEEDSTSETDEDAAVIAALALSPWSVSPAIQAVSAPVALALDGSASSQSGSVEAGALADSPEQDQTSRNTLGYTSDDAIVRIPPSVADRTAQGTAAGSVANQEIADSPRPSDVTAENQTRDLEEAESAPGDQDARKMNPRGPHRVAHVSTRIAPAIEAGTVTQQTPQRPPVGEAGLRLANETGTLSNENSVAATAPATDARTQGRSLADLLAGTVASAQSAPTDFSSGEPSSDRGRDDRRGMNEMTWLRRSSSLESRLAPPVTFMPSVQLAPSAGTNNAHAGALQPSFEMPASAENLSRLVQSIRVQAKDGISQATLRLNPEHLGEVTISIRVESGTVTAVVRAEAGDVRQWLRGQEDSIRAALAEQGLKLDELVVEQDGHRGQDRDQEQEPHARPKNGRAAQVNAPSFEVTA